MPMMLGHEKKHARLAKDSCRARRPCDSPAYGGDARSVRCVRRKHTRTKKVMLASGTDVVTIARGEANTLQGN